MPSVHRPPRPVGTRFLPFLALVLALPTVASTGLAQPNQPDTELLRLEIEQMRTDGLIPDLHRAGLDRRSSRGALVQAAFGMTRTVRVDCGKNQSVQKALDTKADELIIEIEGICVEDVEIARDRVTLLGQDPTADGIRATAGSDDPRQSALLVRDARRVRVENLRFEGSSWNGVRINNSFDGIDLVNVVMTDNGVRGLTLIDSAVTVSDALITGNGDPSVSSGSGVYSFGSSILICDRCTIRDNPELGQGSAAIIDQGEALFRESSLGGSNGLRTAGSGQATFEDGSIDAGTALFATESSSIVTVNSTTAGRILAVHTSRLQLAGSTHTAATPTIAFHDAFLDVSGSIDTTVTMVDFARARLSGGADVVGVTCTNAAQAVCSFGSVVGASSCGGCPVP